MKTSEWTNLLTALAEATERGAAQWSRGDLPNTWILSQPSGAVVLRGPRDLAGMADVLINGRPVIDVEVRSRSEQTVDQLPTLSVLLQSGRVLDATFDVEEPSAIDVEPLQRLAQALYDAVIENSPSGSQVARDILRDLGS